MKPLIRDPEAAGKRWGEKHRAIQLNHLVGVKSTVSKATADEVYGLLLESKKAAGDPPMLPHGLEANRRNLEVAIDCAYKQEHDSAAVQGRGAVRIRRVNRRV